MTRLVSGVALAAAALVAIRFLPLLPLRVLACLVAALAAKEYLDIVDSPIRAVVLAIALCWVVSGTTIVSPLILLTMALLWVAAEILISNHSIQQASTGVFAAVYIGMPLGMLVAVHGLLGWRATLVLLGTVVVSDSMQYYTGRLLGRHPLAPAISPKKTIEGAIGGVIFGTAFLTTVGASVLPFSGYGPLIILGVLVVVLGICGDLFESRLKRTAGMKDSSALIPGHGGVLDRIDALLFAVAPFYLYIRNVT
ncbi:MAG TPA: phosphatidate cytidylyltransferase [Vicinamibacterales bacterium]|nr:phosphatidate cytidylyltransferase [Vicinamibacterales bacterium]